MWLSCIDKVVFILSLLLLLLYIFYLHNVLWFNFDILMLFIIVLLLLYFIRTSVKIGFFCFALLLTIVFIVIVFKCLRSSLDTYLKHCLVFVIIRTGASASALCKPLIEALFYTHIKRIRYRYTYKDKYDLFINYIS